MFVWLALLPFLCCLWAVIAKPKALVHIGPHKAGSTHIQSFLSKYRELFAQSNYHWPMHPDGTPFHYKAVARVAFSLRNWKGQESIMNDFKAFVQSAVQANHNIVLSSEEFSAMDLEATERLAEILADFDVTVVFVYREFVSHVISEHYQRSLVGAANNFRRFSRSFAFDLVRLDSPSHVVQDMQNVDKFTKVFGRNNLRIIDMMGSKESGKDITHTLTCEIMGLLCQREEVFNDKTLESNVQMGLLVMEVFSYFNAFAEQHNDRKCHFCDVDLAVAVGKFHRDYMAMVRTDRRYVLPTIKTNAFMLIPYAIQHDADLRAKYGDIMVKANETANRQAMYHAKFELLDVEAFFQTVPWLSAFETTLNKWMTEKLMCDC